MISVCIATYNGSKYILEQLNSILKQLDINDEIIVSDDNSSDSTCNLIESLNDKRIVLLHHIPQENVPGYIKATLNFENALKHANGDYIFLSDQDDVWCEDKVEKTMKYFREGYDYVVSDAYVTDSNLNVISETRFVKGENVHKNKFLALVLATPYQGSCAAFKKSILKKALPFPVGIQSHDRWIGNVAAFYFKYKIIPEKLILYRRHEGVTSKALGGEGVKTPISTKIKYKLRYISGLIYVFNR